MRRALRPGVVYCFLLAACVAGAGCAETDPEPLLDQPEPEPTATASAGPVPIGSAPSPEARPRQYDRSDTEPQVGLAPGSLGYVATKAVTLASRVDMPTSYFVEGDILSVRVEGWAESRYEATLTLWAHGFSEQDARDHVEAYRINHTDRIDQGTIQVETRVQVPAEPPAAPVPGAVAYPAYADLVLRVPKELHALGVEVAVGGASVDLVAAALVRVTSGNGPVELSNVTGQTVVAVTQNGGVSGHALHAADLALDASNGPLKLSATRAGNVSAHARNGGIDAALAAISNGTWRLTSGNGGADLRLATADKAGFDITAHADNGRATVDVGDTKPVGPQTDGYAHVRTNGFQERPYQVVVGVSAANGNAQVTS